MADKKRSSGGAAGAVMDSVVRKGDPAGRKTSGGPRDPQRGHERRNAPSKAQTGQKWSATLIPTTEDFWRKKQAEDNVYPGSETSIRSRVALLITNIQFSDEDYTRAGAERDEENMENLLSALGYEVVKHTNLTAKGVMEALNAFSQHSKLQDTDSVIVVIMSHGKPDSVLGIDQEEFQIDNICQILGPNCVALQDKPKIIIIQACRGVAAGAVLVSDSASPPVAEESRPRCSLSDEDLEEDALRAVHKEKDFIFLHSSTRDTVSYRDPVKGSLLILAVVDVFNTLAHKHHIEELFKRVARCVKDFPGGYKKQMPSRDRNTLELDFYLFPGI